MPRDIIPRRRGVVTSSNSRHGLPTLPRTYQNIAGVGAVFVLGVGDERRRFASLSVFRVA